MSNINNISFLELTHTYIRKSTCNNSKNVKLATNIVSKLFADIHMTRGDATQIYKILKESTLLITTIKNITNIDYSKIIRKQLFTVESEHYEAFLVSLVLIYHYHNVYNINTHR